MNNPEYCQNIYEAAKEAVNYYFSVQGTLYTAEVEATMDMLMEDLKRALEGKENV